MSYAVKELFYTLQGEGVQAGRPAVFLRFAGCNLWNGLPSGRDTGQGGCARWCDTDFVGINGPGGGKFQDAESLANAVAVHWPKSDTPIRPFVVCTGGEPALQLDTALVTTLHGAGFEIAIETNGTLALPPGIDWICVSPKAGSALTVTSGHELKLVFPQGAMRPQDVEHLAFSHFSLQPMDGPEQSANTQAAVAYCKAHPQWRLSLQTHKFLGIP